MKTHWLSGSKGMAYGVPKGMSRATYRMSDSFFNPQPNFAVLLGDWIPGEGKVVGCRVDIAVKALDRTAIANGVTAAGTKKGDAFIFVSRK